MTSLLFTKEKQRLPMTGLIGVWVVFVLFMAITTIFAYYPDQALNDYIRVVKIQLITFVTMILITDIEKLKKLIWVIVLSIGFFTVKGGIFTLLTGGAHRVWGPPGSFWGDNNAVALTGLVAIPLMLYLRSIYKQQWVKLSFLAATILTLFTTLGSQSRGGLVAICAVSLLFWIKSKNKIISLIFIVFMGSILFSFMPESWHERMETINNYEEDGSAMGRINAWYYSVNAANDNLFGLGLNNWEPQTFLLYAPDPTDVHAAHSIIFGVLGDHGWPGLLFFVSIFFMAWRKLSLIIKQTNKNEDLSDFNRLARMLQVSFVAYLSGGIFLSMSYFDLAWHLVSFVVILNELLIKKNAEKEVEDMKLYPNKI